MLSLVTESRVITTFHRCCLSHHVFDQVNLWQAWVGFETAIFWQCSPGTTETQCLYLLCHRPRRVIKDGFFGLINPYLFFQSQVRTEFLYLSLIGITLRWGFLIWELIFIYCGRRNNTKTTNMKKKLVYKISYKVNVVNNLHNEYF